MLMDYIAQVYDKGQPIFTVDIEVNGITENDKREQLERLLAYGKLLRFDEETVYMPKVSDIKGGSTPSPDTVAHEKYIFRQGKRIGYFGGYTLANKLGISSQVPVKEEIVSNKSEEKESEVFVGSRIYIVRKPPVEVTEENYRILQLLDVLKDVEKYMDDETYVKSQIVSYIEKNCVSRENIDKYIGYFPVETYKNIYEMRLDRVFA